MPEPQRRRLDLFQSSLTYRDDRLAGLDAAVLMEVIEHVDPPRLAALERTVFGHARPGTVIVTTPNVEHNVRFEALPAGTLRHRDHRFEWTPRRVQPAGRAGSLASTGIGCASCRWASTTPRWGRRRRWPPSTGRPRDERPPHPRTQPGGADRRHRLGQVDLRRAAISGRRR